MAVIKAFVSFIFSLRGVVVTLLLIAVFFQNRPAEWQLVDRVLLKAGAQLFLPRSDLVDTVLIQLSAAELHQLQSEPASAVLVFSLLESLRRSTNPVTAIVMDQLPRTNWYAAESLLQGSALDGAQGYLQRRADAMGYLQDENLMLLVPETQGIRFQSRDLATSNETEDNWYGWLPDELQPQLRAVSVNSDSKPGKLLAWELLPLDSTPAYPLVVKADQQLQLSTVLEIFRRSLGADSVRWLNHRQLVMRDKLISTSFDGTLVPFYSSFSGLDAPVKSLSLEQALVALPDKAIVLLGREGDSQLNGPANLLVSLQQGVYWYSPSWFNLMEKILLLLIGLYLLVVVPRLDKEVVLLASLLEVVLMVSAQLGWMLTQSQWLPLGVAIQLLVFGTFFMSVWCSRQRQWHAMETDCHQSNFQLAKQWLQQDHLKEALDAIDKCRTTDAVLGLAYDVAAQQERKRQYSAAADTYLLIVNRRRNFRDAAKRAEALVSLKMGNSQEIPALNATHTLVMPDANLNRPILGRYEIERELGRGAMGVVYLGRDPKIGRQVAIKTLSYKQFDGSQVKDLKERFFREAEAAGRLHHPNIVTVYDVGEEPDLAFIAMDYVEGQSLGDHIKPETLLPVDKVYELVAQVAEALDYAHRQNIVHRDIKPGNIMYNPAVGKVKVADFGIARITDDSKTKTGDILGSPIYMSPEQLKGSKVNGATDIYSLGVTLYQLLTAEVPFNGDSIANLAFQILNKKFKSVRDVRSDLPASSVRIINRAMQKDSSKRYLHAADMAEALRKSLGRDF